MIISGAVEFALEKDYDHVFHKNAASSRELDSTSTFLILSRYTRMCENYEQHGLNITYTNYVNGNEFQYYSRTQFS